MSKKKVRPKFISEEEFQPIMKREWIPVELTFDTLPDWMKSIPEAQRKEVYASGSAIGKNNPKYKGTQVGGFAVLRDAKDHPEPVDWNKDHYVVVRDTSKDDSLIMYGPFKDHEHWINDIPDRLKDVEVLTYKKEQKPKEKESNA